MALLCTASQNFRAILKGMIIIMKSKHQKSTGLFLLVPALLFLFEPYIVTFDILPDFIGYALIVAAIYKIADIDDYFSESKQWFLYAIWIGIARMIAPFAISFVASQSANDKIMWQTMSVFVLDIADAIISVIAFSKLFTGLQYISTFYDGQSVNKRRKKKINGEIVPYGRSACDKFETVTYIFIVVKNLMHVLPEFTSLASNQEYTYVELLRFFGIIPVIVFGLIWAISGVVFFISVCTDKPFMKNLSEKYGEKKSESFEYFKSRKIRAVLMVVIVALIFSMEFYIDSYNVIPDFLSAILLVVAAFMMRKYTKKWIIAFIPSLLSIASSAAYWTFLIQFFDKFRADAYIRKYTQAAVPYLKMYYSCIVSSVIYAIALGCILIAVYDMTKNATKIKSMVTGESHVDRELMRTVSSKLIAAFVLGILSCAGTVYYIYAQPYVSTYAHWYISMSTVISIALDLIFIVFTAFVISDISDEIKNKYKYM